MAHYTEQDIAQAKAVSEAVEKATKELKARLKDCRNEMRQWIYDGDCLECPYCHHKYRLSNRAQEQFGSFVALMIDRCWCCGADMRPEPPKEE